MAVQQKNNALREQVLAFLTKGLEMMASDATREALKDPSVGRPGLALQDMQQKIWDEMAVDRTAGRLGVELIEQMFEKPEELVKLRNDFIKAAKGTYLQCLEDRRATVLEKEAPLTKPVILEFFDACGLKFESKEVQQALVEEIVETHTYPSKTVNETRHAVMELVGFEREHGNASFGKVGEELKQDEDFANAYIKWHGGCDDICMALLRASQRSGVKITGDPKTMMSLLELQAREGIEAMTPEERASLLQKNGQAAQVSMTLSPEKRGQLLASLPEAQILELFQSEALLAVVMQQQKRAQLAKEAASNVCQPMIA